MLPKILQIKKMFIVNLKSEKSGLCLDGSVKTKGHDLFTLLQNICEHQTKKKRYRV